MESKPADLNITSSFVESCKNLFQSKTFLIVAGTALTTIALFGIYQKLNQKDIPLEQKSRIFIQRELQRLKNPKLIEDGILQKNDFFDIILLIQLKSKLKLLKEQPKFQRERIKVLKQALRTNVFVDYFNKTKEFMDQEVNNYEVQYEKILDGIGITHECWEQSKYVYIQRDGFFRGDDGELHSIKQVEKKSYEYLPTYNLGSSLTKERVKMILIEANKCANDIIQNHLTNWISEEDNEYVALIFEALAYDFVFIDQGIQENIFRYATHIYELQSDPEITENLQGFLSS
ncbi:UNKNOWN [Stylonychia lemnae]|uniref:Uncharacterized protein n=1 Tax=Stylonychia lemnae TaxID=5949 RepID=A0A078B9W5_STYLE|nr:UNKNOWN [Stylonychia lemnae]|eukprot:CDW90343.1 UNKNOWN [Stylonychia lemnae]